MKFKGNMTISRDSGDNINISFRDDASLIEFLDVRMSLEDYALMITGVARVGVEGEVRGLQNVCKTKVTAHRRVECPGGLTRDQYKEWLIENCQEEGWILNTYLGSQGSVSYGSGKTFLNYSVYKFVEEEQ